MKNGQAVSIFLAVGIHAFVLWGWRQQALEVPLAAGVPEGAQADVELVGESPAEETTPTEQTEPAASPQPAAPDPPAVEPVEEPSPMPVPEAPPSPPVAPDDFSVDPPKPKPKPKSSRPSSHTAAAASASASSKPGPAAAASAAPSGRAPGVGTGGADGEPRARYKVKVTPVYPEALRKAGIQGRVEVMAVIGPQGRAISVRIGHSSGNASFDEAALAAARACEFYPKKTLGIPVQDTVAIPYNFVIRQ